MENIPLDEAEVRILRTAEGDMKSAQLQFETAVGLVIRSKKLTGRYKLSEDLTQLIPVEGEMPLPAKGSK